MIYLQLLLAFAQIGIVGIGGGYAALGQIQRTAVEQYHWLSMSEYMDLVTISEMTPGPITINAATFVGMRTAGFAGAMTATMGCVLPACALSSLIACVYLRYRDSKPAQTVLSGLRPAVIALIASAALSILITMLFSGQAPSLGTFSPLKATLLIIAFALLRLKKTPPILTMCLCAAAYCILSMFMA